MNELQIFNNAKFGKLEVVVLDGKVYFRATEVAEALGYKDAVSAVRQHCKGMVKHPVLTKGGKQLANFIPESDAIRLITKSHLKSAEEFESWVFDEVIPKILRTGEYSLIRKDTSLTQQIKLNNSRARLANTCIKLANDRDVNKVLRGNLLYRAAVILMSDKEETVNAVEIQGFDTFGIFKDIFGGNKTGD